MGLRKAGTYSNLYGIYATSNRIVGVKPNALPYILIPVAALGILLPFAELVSLTHFPLLFLGALVLIVVVTRWILKRWGKKEPTSVTDLDVRKHFEILRQDISRIELKKAGLLSGHLRIQPVAGEAVNFPIGSKFGAYDQLKGLLVEFCSIPPQIEFLEGV